MSIPNSLTIPPPSPYSTHKFLLYICESNIRHSSFLKCLHSFLLHQVLVVANGISSCCMWDIGPWPGTKPGPHALETWNLSHWATREVPGKTFFLALRVYTVKERTIWRNRTLYICTSGVCFFLPSSLTSETQEKQECWETRPSGRR